MSGHSPVTRRPREQHVATKTKDLTLADFLLARLREDEDLWAAVAEAKQAHPARTSRWVADIDAKRRILAAATNKCSAWREDDDLNLDFPTLPHYPDEGWGFCDGCSSAASADAEIRWVIATLATAYSTHPDYREEWRP